MSEFTGLDGQNAAVWNGLTNEYTVVKEALGNQCTFFCLDYQITLLYMQ